MKKIAVVTPPDALHGFALAGVRQVVADAEEVVAALRSLAREPLIGVVMLDERLAAPAAREQLREMDRRWPGVAIVLPAPHRAQVREEDYVLQLIRRAIGYQVRLS